MLDTAPAVARCGPPPPPAFRGHPTICQCHPTAALFILQVVKLLKDPHGVVTGARVKDVVAGTEFDVHAKVVVNATGIHTDSLRRLSNAEAAAKPMISPSSGVHITLPDFYSPDSTGLIIPKTKVRASLIAPRVPNYPALARCLSAVCWDLEGHLFLSFVFSQSSGHHSLITACIAHLEWCST